MLKYQKFNGVAALEKAAKNDPWLRWGENGPHIAIIQNALSLLGYAFPNSIKAGKMDGIYGGETYSAVSAFQKKYKLKPDGILGKDTMGALDAAMVLAAKPIKITPPPKRILIVPPKTVRFNDGWNYDLTLIKSSFGHACFLDMSIKFKFEDGATAKWVNTAEKIKFMQDWKSAVEQKWSISNLYTSPKFGVVPFTVRLKTLMGTGKTEWVLTIEKKDPNVSMIVSWVRDGFIWNTSKGDSGDVIGVNKGAIDAQRAAVHEFGHMIGLPDEYASSKPSWSPFEVPHSNDKNSIMNAGEKLRKRHHDAFRNWVKDYFNE